MKLSLLMVTFFWAGGYALLCGTLRAEHSHFHSALESITVEELFEHVDVLADDTLEGRAAGSRGGQAAARYVESRLREIGVAAAGEGGRFTQPFYGTHQNLLAKVEGSDEQKSDEWLLVGAHYDHVGYGTPQTSYGPIGYIHNGADDNASGVSVLLETIEAVMQLGKPPRRSILFAFWDGEEQGLLGSRYWLQRPTIPFASIQLAVNIDMVGRMRRGRLEVGGTRSGYGLRRLLASRSLADGLWLHFDWELQENSDHWPFFERGVPVVLLHTGLHDDYHRPSDDVERVNRQGMRDAAAYLFDFVVRAANADELPRFRPSGRNETPYTQRERERPLAPLPPRLGVGFRDVREEQPADDSGSGEPTSSDAAKSTPSVERGQGVVVTSVAPNSPAAIAGLEVGDRIEAVSGVPVLGGSDFQWRIQTQPAQTQLQVVRDAESQPIQLDVRLAGEPSRLGISWRADDAEPRAVYLTRVIPGTPAARAGLLIFDRVYAIHAQPFESADEFGRLLEKELQSEGPLRLTIERHGRLTAVEIAIH
jgi:hypothetical protein